MEPSQETLLEKIEAFQQFFIFPAMTILPVVRRRIGLRSLKGFYFWLPLAVMGAVGYQYSTSHVLAYFAVFVAGVALWQRRNRWKEIRSGKLWHTRSLGVSLWEFLPDLRPKAPEPGEEPKPPSSLLKIGPFFQTDRRLYRWIDPLCIFIIGLIVFRFDQVFGGWIMFSAVSLRITEEYIWEKSIEALLDQYDGLITAEQQNEALQALRRGHPTTGADGVEIPRPAPAPPPNGVAEDLREQVAARKAEADAREANRQQEKARPHPFTDTMNRVKEGADAVKDSAEAVKEAADAVYAFRAATAVRETVIVATERTTREVVIVQPEYATYRVVIPGPIPDGMGAQAWLLTYSVYPGRFTFTPEQQAEILAAYDKRQITGDTTPIVVQPPAAAEPPR